MMRTVDGQAVACPDLETWETYHRLAGAGKTWETYHRLAGAGKWAEATAVIAPRVCPDLPAGHGYKTTGGRARVETTYADGRKGRLVFLQLIMPDGTLAWVRESKLVAE